ncbi:MAG: hypothetical protein JWL60_761 [Gemmatimonadetes bacterium]|jgi:hypothetical protein|nr:hypothetical protein [Gemmatimonadota bacterium]
MDDDRQGAGPQGEDTPTREAPAATPTRAPKKRRLGLKLAAIFLLLPALLFAAWSIVALNWSYSEGERAGYVQKFSKKGWLCKTWEGELAMVNMPGTAPELFRFTVRNDSVASAVTKLMGSRVALTYEEHKGIPGSCFGETGYYVKAAKAVAAP